MLRGAAYYRGFELVEHSNCFLIQSVDAGEDLFALQANSIEYLFRCIDEMLDPAKQTAETRPAWMGDWNMIGTLVLEPPEPAFDFTRMLSSKPAPRKSGSRSLAG